MNRANPERNKKRCLTNAIANAGLRVGWNIRNLYIHLCWQTVKQQFIPALAIASAVGAKFGNHGKLQNINLLRLFVPWKFLPTENLVFSTEFLSGQFWLPDLTVSAWILCLTNLPGQTWFDFSARQNYSTSRTFLAEILGKPFYIFSCQFRI